MQPAIATCRAWIWTVMAARISRHAYCADAGAGPRSLEVFHREVDAVASRVREEWDELFISIQEDEAAGTNLESFLKNAANLGYLRTAFREQDAKFEALSGKLSRMEPGDDGLVKNIAAALEEYYGFMVDTMQKMLSKYLYRVVDGAIPLRFEDIPEYDTTHLPSPEMEDEEMFARMKTDEVGDKARLFSAYVGKLRDLIIGELGKSNAELRRVAEEVGRLSGELENCNREMAAAMDEKLDGGKEPLSEEVVALNGEIKANKRAIAELAEEKDVLENRILQNDEIIDNTIDSAAEHGSPSEFEFLQGRLCELVDNKGDAPGLLIDATYVMDYLPVYVSDILLEIVKHVKKHGELSGEAILEDARRLANDIRDVHLPDLYQEIVNCGNIAMIRMGFSPEGASPEGESVL